jgi:hypothetical protein
MQRIWAVRGGMIVAVLVALLAVGVAFRASGSVAHAAQNSEQVVFSGTAAGVFNDTSTPVGFWIWCEADSANSYVGECNGAMHFNGLGLTKHVIDVDGGIIELAEGQYQITVGSTDGSVACTLTNTLPVTQGPTNTVTVTCTSPAGTGSSTTAVVRVTGP